MKTKNSKIIAYFILFLLSILWVLPIFSGVIAASKTNADYMSSKFYEFPETNTLMQNIKDLFRYFKLQENFKNSLLYAVCGVVICILLSSTAAFGITKLRPKGSFLLFLIIYSGTVFPFQLYLVPLFRNYTALGIYNTKFGMILLYGAICTPFATFLYRGSFLGMSDDVMEAGLLDGCGPAQVFFRIYLPQLKAPTAVVALFQGMWIWNDMLFGMILSTGENVRPIMVAVAQACGLGSGKIPIMMAGALITSIPTVLLFLVLKKYFIQGFALQTATD